MTQPVQLPPLRSSHLLNFRKRRYLGDDLCMPVSAFDPADRERVRQLYEFLQAAFVVFSPSGRSSAADLSPIAEFIERQDLRTMIRTVQAFGPASYAATPSELMAKTLHDVRGGGLTFLLNHLQFVKMGEEIRPETARTLFSSLAITSKSCATRCSGSTMRNVTRICSRSCTGLILS